MVKSDVIQIEMLLFLFSSDESQTNLLLIDGLIDDIGAPVKSLWEKEGGTGLYPPPSIHVSNRKPISFRL